MLLGATNAHATPITWTLQNFVFEDGGVATGSFTYDADTDITSNIAITTTAGTIRGGNTYGVPTPNSGASLFDTVDALPVQDGITPRLFFSLVSPMTNAGGTILVGNPNRFEFTCATHFCDFASDLREIVSGSVTTNVPEPTAMLLFGTGAVGLIARRRGRKM